MTTRDRLVLIGGVVLAVLVAAWLLAVAPERERAASLATQVSAAQTQLTGAESQLSNARAAQAKYAQAYASIVGLGKAVPASEEVPSLIFQLAQASNQKRVEFASITATNASGSSSGSSSATSSSSTAAITGFTQMPFTFVFNGSFFDLYNLFQQLNHFTLRTASGDLQVSGRLLTIQGVKLTPLTNSNGGSAGQLSGTITATAYVLPTGQSLTGGATPAGPAGAATQTASSTSTSSSPTAPAVIQVNP